MAKPSNLFLILLITFGLVTGLSLESSAQTEGAKQERQGGERMQRGQRGSQDGRRGGMRRGGQGRGGQGRGGRGGVDKGLKVGQSAPTFVLKSLDGTSETDLATFKGQKPVVLMFGSYT